MILDHLVSYFKQSLAVVCLVPQAFEIVADGAEHDLVGHRHFRLRIDGCYSSAAILEHALESLQPRFLAESCRQAKNPVCCQQLLDQGWIV